MSSVQSLNATGWPVSQNLGESPAQQNVKSADVASNERASSNQPAGKKRTLLPNIPFPNLQVPQVVRTANVRVIAYLPEPAVDREVEMTLATQTEPSARRFVCPCCKKSLARKLNLQEHIIRRHKNLLTEEQTSSSKFQCIMAGLSSKRKVKAQGRQWKCPHPHCVKISSSKRNAQDHIIAVHQDLRLHRCEFVGCGMTFNYLSVLKSHTNDVHRRLKPFPCSVCGKRFARKENRGVHMVLKHL